MHINVVKMLRTEVEWEKLPLMGRDLVEELPEELFVGPCARSNAPWQAVIGEFVADEQPLQGSNGVVTGVYERREYPQVMSTDDADVDVKTTVRECVQHVRNASSCPVLAQGGHWNVILRVTGDVPADVLGLQIGDELGEFAEGFGVDVRSHRPRTRCEPVATTEGRLWGKSRRRLCGAQSLLE